MPGSISGANESPTSQVLSSQKDDTSITNPASDKKGNTYLARQDVFDISPRGNPKVLPSNSFNEFEAEMVEMDSDDQINKQVISFDENLKHEIGEEKYNKTHSWFNDAFNKNAEMKELADELNADFESLSVELKSFVLVSSGISQDTFIDDFDVKHPRATILISLAGSLTCGTNSLILADPNATIGPKEIFASQNTVFLCIMSTMNLIDTLGNCKELYLKEYNETHNLEPSDSRLENTKRIINHFTSKNGFISGYPSKFDKLVLGLKSLLGVLSVPVAYISSRTDYQGVILGLKSLFTQLGIDENKAANLSYLGYLNLAFSIILVSKISYDVGLQTVDNLMDITKACINKCVSDDKRLPTSSENTMQEHTSLISKSIMDSIVKCANEDNFESLTEEMKNNVVSTLRLNNIENITDNVSEILKNKLKTTSNTSACLSKDTTVALKGGVDTLAAAVFGVFGLFGFSGCFGASMILERAIEATNQNNGTTPGISLPHIDGTVHSYRNFPDAVTNFNFNNLNITDAAKQMVMIEASSNRTTNMVQGMLFGTAFIALFTTTIFLAINTIKKPRATATMFDPRTKNGLKRLLSTVAGVAFSMVSFTFYGMNIMETKNPARALFELEHKNFLADISTFLAVFTTLALSVFVIQGGLKSPEFIRQIPKMITQSIRNTAYDITSIGKGFVNCLGRGVNLFRSTPQIISSRAIEEVPLD